MPRTTDKLFKAIKQRIENAIECSPRISVIEKENIASDMLAIFVVELGRKNKAIAELAAKLRERKVEGDKYVKIPVGYSRIGTGHVNIIDKGGIVEVSIHYKVNDEFENKCFAIPSFLPTPPKKEKDDANFLSV